MPRAGRTRFGQKFSTSSPNAISLHSPKSQSWGQIILEMAWVKKSVKGQIDRTLLFSLWRLGQICIFFIFLDWQGEDHQCLTRSFIIRQQVSGVKTTSEETCKNMHWTLRAYLHTLTGLWWLAHEHLQWELAQTPNTRCRAAVGVNAGVTRRVSHSIPRIRTGDSPRGHEQAKDGNPIPIRKSGARTSAAGVIHSSCDTTAMCWGLFVRNGRVELESSWILLASVWAISWRGWKALVEECSVFVCVLKLRFRSTERLLELGLQH